MADDGRSNVQVGSTMTSMRHQLQYLAIQVSKENQISKSHISSTTRASGVCERSWVVGFVSVEYILITVYIRS